jgi:RNA polymerase I-specific transcription initiation factor RRN5
MNMESQAESDTSLDDIPLAQIRTQKEGNDSSVELLLDGQSESSSDGHRPLSGTAQQMSRKAAADQRWKRLRKYYSDQYVDLFKETFSHESLGDGVPHVHLPSTQLGAVIWTSDEKLKLFKATSRKGRLDIPSIAEAVASKSQLEVQDYLSFLRQEEDETYLFARHQKGISHADIPAAVEINEECESALEKAADALAAYQDQYDNAANSVMNDVSLVIDREMAMNFDAKVDDEDQTSDIEETFSASARLFRLVKFIELSERIFMNPGSANLNTNWRHIATEAESPALTYSAVTEFHELVLSLTRRLMQTALFLAQSRLRCSRVQGYATQSVVKRQDVTAALDVLGVSGDLWSYWVKVARRNKLNVIADLHTKGGTVKDSLPYESVEAALAIRTARDYRKSRSVTTDASSVECSENEPDIGLPSVEDEQRQAGGQSANSSPPASREDEDNLVSESVSSSTEDESSSADEFVGLSFHTTTLKQKRQQVLLDLEQDQYLEQIDKSASRREEARLWQILGREQDMEIKAENEDGDVRPRPKILRKAKDDLRDWAGTYEAEWEHFGELVPVESFPETEYRRKRRRLNASFQVDGQAKRLPLR